VAVLPHLRDAGHDPSVDEVREALQSLAGKGVVEKVRRTVPTYRLALPRNRLRVEERSEASA